VDAVGCPPDCRCPADLQPDQPEEGIHPAPRRPTSPDQPEEEIHPAPRRQTSPRREAQGKFVVVRGWAGEQSEGGSSRHATRRL